MKRLLSEVKAASEKQQTNAHHRERMKVSAEGGGGGEWRQTVKGTRQWITWPHHRENSAIHQACPPETTPPVPSDSYTHRFSWPRGVWCYHNNIMASYERQINSFRKCSKCQDCSSFSRYTKFCCSPWLQSIAHFRPGSHHAGCNTV